MRQAVCAIIRPDWSRPHWTKDIVLSVSRKDNPFDFGLPGGKVDDGETPEEACVREIKEETGLDISSLSKVYEGVCYSPSGEDFWTICFLVESYSGEVSQMEGEGDVAWCGWNELTDPRMTFAPYNEKVKEALDSRYR